MLPPCHDKYIEKKKSSSAQRGGQDFEPLSGLILSGPPGWIFLCVSDICLSSGDHGILKVGKDLQSHPKALEKSDII